LRNQGLFLLSRSLWSSNILWYPDGFGVDCELLYPEVKRDTPKRRKQPCLKGSHRCLIFRYEMQSHRARMLNCLTGKVSFCLWQPLVVNYGASNIIIKVKNGCFH